MIEALVSCNREEDEDGSTTLSISSALLSKDSIVAMSPEERGQPLYSHMS